MSHIEFQHYFICKLNKFCNIIFQMDIKDFEGIFKFKLIVPTLSILAFINTFYRMLYVASSTESDSVTTFEYIVFWILFLKSILLTIGLARSYRGLVQVVRDEQKRAICFQEQKILLGPENDIVYSFVIPNYKEDMEVLQNTLDALASHTRAQKYCIFLAMECAEQGCEAKAEKIKSKYNSKFRVIHDSYHRLKGFELAGKASNVSSCVEGLQPFFKSKNINTTDMFFTIIDADTIIPNLYIDELERKIKQEYTDRFNRFYVCPQLYFYNDNEATFMVRTMDNYHSMAHLHQLANPFGIMMPLSNYTLSYDLVKRIGYWDTCADAIGEDYHTAIKSYLKTHGQVVAREIFVPMNQMNIITGQGMIADIKARFWQGVRHIEGVATFAYLLNNLSKVKINKKIIGVFLFYAETIILGFIAPFIMSSVFYESGYRFIRYQKVEPAFLTFFVLVTISGEITYYTFAKYKALAMKHIYKQESSSFKLLFEMKVLFLPITYVFLIPMFLVGSIRTILKNRSYARAQKKIAKENTLQQIESS